MNDQSNDGDKINDLEKRIQDLKKRWPAHSVPPAMFQELEDLEEELALAMADREKKDA